MERTETIWNRVIGPEAGIVAVVGGGGKSTLLATAGDALARTGARTVLATTTHMLAPAGIPLTDTTDAGGDPGSEAAARTAAAARAALASPSAARGAGALIACGARDAATGKLSAPAGGVEPLARACDIVLVEADGSRHLPVKAHAPHEPVIPAASRLVIYVVGAAGFDRPVAQAVHRPELFCARTGAAAGDPVTPELVARGILEEGILDRADRRNLVIVNQAEDGAAIAWARRLAAALPWPTWAGSIRDGLLVRL